jgi:hypothetical protein
MECIICGDPGREVRTGVWAHRHPTDHPFAFVEEEPEAEIPAHVLSGQQVTGRVLRAHWKTALRVQADSPSDRNQAAVEKRLSDLLEYIDAHPHLVGTEVDPR